MHLSSGAGRASGRDCILEETPQFREKRERERKRRRERREIQKESPIDTLIYLPVEVIEHVYEIGWLSIPKPVSAPFSAPRQGVRKAKG